MAPDFYWRIVVLPVLFRIKVVVDGCQDYVVPDQGAIPDFNPSLILKMASRVDEHLFPNGNILSEVRIEGRKQPEGIVYPFACQPAHNLPQLFRGVVLVIHRFLPGMDLPHCTAR